MDKEQLIQGYITGTISEEEKLTVENLLKSDAEFKSEFEMHKDLVAAFEISERNNLKKHFQNVEKNLDESARFKFPKSIALYAAIACAVVIGIYYNFYGVETGNSLYKSNFNQLPNTYQPIVRGTNSNNTDAFSAYENGDFKKAEKEFEQILLLDEDPNIQFYYGLSLLNQSKFDLALNQFIELENVNHDYKSEELWYTALIYLKKEDFQKTKQYLKRIKSTKFKSEEKKLLLQKLEDR